MITLTRKAAEDLTQKEITTLLNNKSMNLRSNLFDIEQDLEDILYGTGWDELPVTVGMGDASRAEEIIADLLKSLFDVRNKIKTCRRSF